MCPSLNPTFSTVHLGKKFCSKHPFDNQTFVLGQNVLAGPLSSEIDLAELIAVRIFKAREVTIMWGIQADLEGGNIFEGSSDYNVRASDTLNDEIYKDIQ